MFMFYFVNFQCKLFWNVVCHDSEIAREQKKDIFEVMFHSTRLWQQCSEIFIRIFTKHLHTFIQIEGGVSDFETLKLPAKRKIQIDQVPVKKVMIEYGGFLYADF